MMEIMSSLDNSLVLTKERTLPLMQPTLLANTWMTAHLPGTKYMAIVCCAGSAGESAVQNSTDSLFTEAGYQHKVATLRRPRPAIFYLIGTVITNFVEAPQRRIIRLPVSPAAPGALNPFKFHRVRILSNAASIPPTLVACHLDMSAMVGVTSLVNNFFTTCLLKSIQLPPNLEEFGAVFQNSTNLTEMDMSLMSRVKKIPSQFVQGCYSLQIVKFPPSLEDLDTITIPTLTSLDMSSLACVKTLPAKFMQDCTKLHAVKFPPNLEEIGKSAFQGCTSLTEIDMSSLSGVKTLPAGFMGGCTSLQAVKFPPNLEEVGQSVFQGCGRAAISQLQALNVTVCK